MPELQGGGQVTEEPNFTNLKRVASSANRNKGRKKGVIPTPGDRRAETGPERARRLRRLTGRG